MTENEMVGWHHQLSGHEFEQTQGANKGQPFPSPRDLPDPGIKPMAPTLAGRLFIAGKPEIFILPPGKPTARS